MAAYAALKRRRGYRDFVTALGASQGHHRRGNHHLGNHADHEPRKEITLVFQALSF